LDKRSRSAYGALFSLALVGLKQRGRASKKRSTSGRLTMIFLPSRRTGSRFSEIASRTLVMPSPVRLQTCASERLIWPGGGFDDALSLEATYYTAPIPRTSSGRRTPIRCAHFGDQCCATPTASISDFPASSRMSLRNTPISSSSRPRTPARSQDHGRRESHGSTGSGTGKKADPAVAIASTGRYSKLQFVDRKNRSIRCRAGKNTAFSHSVGRVAPITVQRTRAAFGR